MGWLIALGILVLLAVLPLGVDALYDSSGPRVKLAAGPVRITLYPRNKKKPKEKKPEKPKETQKQKQKTPAAAQAPEKSGGSWQDFLPLVRLGLDFLGDFRRKLRVNRLEMKLILAGDDPADLGMAYGRAWAALGNLWPRLERCFVIKKRDVQIECDFEASKTLITARLELTITLGRLLVLGVGYGIRALKEYLKIKNQGKGGAAT